jgi:hypothetical protein
MSLDEDEILAGALGSAAARRLKKSVLEVGLVLAIAPAAAAERTRQVLDELGRRGTVTAAKLALNAETAAPKEGGGADGRDESVPGVAEWRVIRAGERHGRLAGPRLLGAASGLGVPRNPIPARDGRAPRICR